MCFVSLTPETGTPSAQANCAFAHTGDGLESARCIVGNLDPKANVRYLTKSDLKVRVSDNTLVSISVSRLNDDLQIGELKTKGPFELKLLLGQPAEICIARKTRATILNYPVNTMENPNCLRYFESGKPLRAVLPAKINEIFGKAQLNIGSINTLPSDSSRVTFFELVLAKPSTICGEAFPANTRFWYNEMGFDLPIKVRLPTNASLHDGRKPTETQSILLTDDKLNCNVSIVENNKEE